MRGNAHETLSELTATSPAFLRKLDTEPDQARHEFIDLAYRYMSVSPPRPLTWYPWIEAEEFFAQIIEHFLEDDCCRLRRYADRGQPFIAWFRTVAELKSRDIISRILWEGKRFPSKDAIEEERGVVGTQNAPSTDPLLRKGLQNALDSFRGTNCHCLLIWRLERGYSNREIARMLRLPPHKNMAIGNRYRECRVKLRDELERTGLAAEYLS